MLDVSALDYVSCPTDSVWPNIMLLQDTSSGQSMKFWCDDWSRAASTEVNMWGTGDRSILALQVGLGAPKIVSASLSLQMSTCGMFRVLVSWHVAVLCLPTSFQAGSSGHRCHLQSQCVSSGCHLLFYIIKKICCHVGHQIMVQLTTSYTGHYSFHRTYTWWLPGQLTPELKGRAVDTCLLSCLSLQICGHGLFKWHLWLGHSILNIIHMPDVEMSTYYHTVISYGVGLLSLSLYQIWVSGAFPGDKGGWCIKLTTLPPSCAIVMKSGNLNFLRTLWACPGL